MQEALLNSFSAVRIIDVLDIFIVAFIIYKVLGFIRETRAEQLVKGLLLLIIIAFLSEYLKLYTLSWILRNTMTLGVVALLIVFQPELRRGLEYLGRTKFLTRPFSQISKENAKYITKELISAVDHFSVNKIGALIIIERETSLNDIAETGIILDADISTELLENIFYEKSPLHDGACVLRGGKISAAACVLPLTENRSLSKELGTRHRAGLGISERSDSVAIIVSEESGIISIAIDGHLSRFLDIKSVEKTILNIYLDAIEDPKEKVPFMKIFRRRKKND